MLVIYNIAEWWLRVGHKSITSLQKAACPKQISHSSLKHHEGCSKGQDKGVLQMKFKIEKGHNEKANISSNLQVKNEKDWNSSPLCPCLSFFLAPAVPLNETRPTTKHTSGFIPFVQPCTASLSPPLIYCLPRPAKHVVYPTMIATSLCVHGFSTACNGKMCAVGIGYRIGMDASSCRECWTLQDSITDLAPRLCSPFIGNQRIFVNLYSNSYSHQCQTLEEIACTYQCTSISPANRCCL